MPKVTSTQAKLHKKNKKYLLAEQAISDMERPNFASGTSGNKNLGAFLPLLATIPLAGYINISNLTANEFNITVHTLHKRHILSFSDMKEYFAKILTKIYNSDTGTLAFVKWLDKQIGDFLDKGGRDLINYKKTTPSYSKMYIYKIFFEADAPKIKLLIRHMFSSTENLFWGPSEQNTSIGSDFDNASDLSQATNYWTNIFNRFDDFNKHFATQSKNVTLNPHTNSQNKTLFNFMENIRTFMNYERQYLENAISDMHNTMSGRIKTLEKLSKFMDK